jgi:hypothetical protein
MKKILASLAIAISFISLGCVAEPTAGSLSVQRVTADDLAALDTSKRLVVSVGENDPLLFDSSAGAIDFGRIDIVCPNGQQMAADVWLHERAKEQNLDLGQTISNELSLARNMEDARAALRAEGSPSYKAQATDPVINPCVCCTDGLCICWED